MNKALGALFVALFTFVGLLSGVSAAKEPEKTLVSAMKVIAEKKELSKFAGLIEDAGLQAMFEAKDQQMTVFAPSNDALGKVPSDMMKKAKSDKEHLQKFVKYHVITGSQVFMGNIKGRKAGPGTASGESLAFDGVGKTLKVNDAEFVTPDIAASNGVVHVMSAAMIPPSFTEKPEAEKFHERPEMPGGKEPAAPEPGKASKEAPAGAAAPRPAAPGAVPVTTPETKKKGLGGWLKSLGW